jgi:hypothetical protein
LARRIRPFAALSGACGTPSTAAPLNALQMNECNS